MNEFNFEPVGSPYFLIDSTFENSLDQTIQNVTLTPFDQWLSSPLQMWPDTEKQEFIRLAVQCAGDWKAFAQRLGIQYKAKDFQLIWDNAIKECKEREKVNWNSIVYDTFLITVEIVKAKLLKRKETGVQKRISGLWQEVAKIMSNLTNQIMTNNECNTKWYNRRKKNRNNSHNLEDFFINQIIQEMPLPSFDQWLNSPLQMWPGTEKQEFIRLAVQCAGDWKAFAQRLGSQDKAKDFQLIWDNAMKESFYQVPYKNIFQLRWKPLAVETLKIVKDEIEKAMPEKTHGFWVKVAQIMSTLSEQTITNSMCYNKWTSIKNKKRPLSDQDSSIESKTPKRIKYTLENQDFLSVSSSPNRTLVDSNSELILNDLNTSDNYISILQEFD